MECLGPFILGAMFGTTAYFVIALLMGLFD